MPTLNPGPAVQTTFNTQPPQSNHAKIETLSLNLGTIAAIPTISTSEITFSGLGTGILPGDVILGVSKPTTQAGLGIAGFRNDPAVPDKFYVTFVNPTAAGITPTASETYQVTIARPIPGSAALTSVV